MINGNIICDIALVNEGIRYEANPIQLMMVVVLLLPLFVSKQRLGPFNATEVFINWLDAIQDTFIKEHINMTIRHV